LGLVDNLHGTTPGLTTGSRGECPRGRRGPHQQGPCAPPTAALPPPKEFTGGSRTPTPEGSLPPCGWGKYPYPPDYRAAFASSLLLSPLPHGSPLRGAYRRGRHRASPVPRVCPRGLGPASAPGARHLRRVSSEHPALAPYLLVQASQHLWLVINNGACG